MLTVHCVLRWSDRATRVIRKLSGNDHLHKVLARRRCKVSFNEKTYFTIYLPYIQKLRWTGSKTGVERKTRVFWSRLYEEQPHTAVSNTREPDYVHVCLFMVSTTPELPISYGQLEQYHQNDPTIVQLPSLR